MADGQGDRDPDENDQRSSNDATNSNPPNGASSLNSMVHAYAQEYENVDHMLDEIDSWMNKLEEQNDTLNSELDILLESSRQTRKELQEQNQEVSNGGNNDTMDSSDGSGEKNS